MLACRAFDERRHDFAQHRDEVHEQRLARALPAHAERTGPHGAAHIFFLFSFVAARPGAARQISARRDTRRRYDHPMQGPSWLAGLSSSTDYFHAMRDECARNRQTISPERAARPFPIRPYRKIAFSQGNPGIFSHFLRNYR
ncbi:hypothetical protein [Burkholderia territorii]|uniref:hypothetical protein n=2 Tax=Burkholderia territorii TaxID=1503055 RepID=UPI000A57DC48|nr:hypothetical protein [Burkholderia territorii]